MVVTAHTHPTLRARIAGVHARPARGEPARGLPAAAAAEAPTEHTGFVTGMTNMTKTVGGALASSVFAIALSTTGSIDADAAENHASLGGYMTVWAICGASALLAAVVLALRGPRRLEATTPTG